MKCNMFSLASTVKKSIIPSAFLMMLTFFSTNVSAESRFPFEMNCKSMQSYFNSHFKSNQRTVASHFADGDMRYIQSDGLEAVCSGGYVITSDFLGKRVCKAEIGYYDLPHMFDYTGPKLTWDYASTSDCRLMNERVDDSPKIVREDKTVEDILPYAAIGVSIAAVLIGLKK